MASRRAERFLGRYLEDVRDNLYIFGLDMSNRVKFIASAGGRSGLDGRSARGEPFRTDTGNLVRSIQPPTLQKRGNKIMMEVVVAAPYAARLESRTGLNRPTFAPALEWARERFFENMRSS